MNALEWIHIFSYVKVYDAFSYLTVSKTIYKYLAYSLWNKNQIDHSAICSQTITKKIYTHTYTITMKCTNKKLIRRCLHMNIYKFQDISILLAYKLKYYKYIKDRIYDLSIVLPFSTTYTLYRWAINDSNIKMIGLLSKNNWVIGLWNEIIYYTYKRRKLRIMKLLLSRDHIPMECFISTYNEIIKYNDERYCTLLRKRLRGDYKRVDIIKCYY